MPNIIFTDGAAEGTKRSVVSVGGVLFRPCAGGALFFSCEVPAPIVARWTSGGKRQVIGQAEVFPVLVAKLTWAEQLKGMRNIYFIDNDSARYALIAGASPISSTKVLLLYNTVLDAMSPALHWYARVPTEANTAMGHLD